MLAMASAVYAPASLAQTTAWRVPDYWCNLYECSTKFDPAPPPAYQQGVAASSYATAASLQFAYLTAYWNANNIGRGTLSPGAMSYLDVQSAGILWSNASTWQNCDQTGACWTINESQAGQVTPWCQSSATTLKSAIYGGPMQWQCHSCPDGNAWSEAANACVPFPIDEGSCSVADPVLPGTGRKLHEETDYAGTGAAALNLHRFYRSQWTDGAIGLGLTPDLTESAGWRLSIHARLTLLPSGHMRAFRPDGTTIDFSPSAATADTWAVASSRDGLKGLLGSNGQRSGYTYMASVDDSTETYDAAGKLLSIKARNGWVTTMTYNSVGQLTSVRNQFGRELRFTYDTKGRLAELLPPGAIAGTAAGAATSPIRYAYAEAASLGAGVAPKDQLSSVTWQDGGVRRYHYEDSRFAQALTGITDEAGVRYATYSYDAQGRVSQTGHVGGVDRVDFSYGTSSDGSGSPQTIVTDYSGPNGSATTRTYTFQNAGGVMRPTAITAPCPLCGSTQASTSYDAGSNPTKTIAHDGSVTFYAYDAKGRETERATFPSSYQSTATRPALANATGVVSTKWHTTWMLPTQISEPNKVTTSTYDAKGNLTGQSWTATADPTGAAKFVAVKTGSTYATGWGWNTSGLNTSIVTKTDAAETGRWTLQYNALGDVASITDAQLALAGGATQYDPAGRLIAGTTTLGQSLSYGYSPRGFVATRSIDGKKSYFTQNKIGLTTDVLLPDNQTIRFEYDGTYRLTNTRLNGALLTVGMLREGVTGNAYVAVLQERLRTLVEALHATANAQAAIAPGLLGPGTISPGMALPGQPGASAGAILNGDDSASERPGGTGLPLFDPRARPLAEVIARWCRCNPSGGFSKPTLTGMSYAHIAISGHLGASFANKSYFTEPVNQALVDEIVSKDPRLDPPGDDRRKYFVLDMGRPVGFVRNSAGTFTQTRSATMIVHKNNCDNVYRVRNEVITMYPGQ